jgi:hypothetical protein
MASAVPDSCCKSYEPKCAQKPYGKHPSNIFYEVLMKDQLPSLVARWERLETSDLNSHSVISTSDEIFSV